jgi:hypothetical protein
MENNRDLELKNLDRARCEFLDKLFLGVPERICSYGDRSYVALMSPEEVQYDHDSWMKVIEKVKINGTIQDIILIIQLMKETDAMIRTFRTFCPFENVFRFYGFAEEGEELLEDEEFCFISMKICQTFLRLGLKEEEEMISNKLEDIMETMNMSQNETVVNYFTEIIENFQQ